MNTLPVSPAHLKEGDRFINGSDTLIFKERGNVGYCVYFMIGLIENSDKHFYIQYGIKSKVDKIIN